MAFASSLLSDSLHSGRDARFSRRPGAKPPVWRSRLWLGVTVARVWSCGQLCECSIQGVHASPDTCTTYDGTWGTEPDKPVLQTAQVLTPRTNLMINDFYCMLLLFPKKGKWTV